MKLRSVLWVLAFGGAMGWSGSANRAIAQSFGIELHNSLMPAAGGMAGVSVARPQDALSAINGNPATLVDFDGTRFSFGGAWVEGTYNVTQESSLPLVGVSPFQAKSATPGALTPNIGVTRGITPGGLPMAWGIGLITNAGAGADFREVPASAGTNGYYSALDLTSGLAAWITPRMSVGGAVTLGTSFIDGPFVDVAGMTPGYGLRGTLGARYDLSRSTSIGAYWQTKKHFQFDQAAQFRNGQTFDVSLDHPQNLGLGIANRSLLSGRLILAADVLFKKYSQADFLGSIYDDQWVYLVGAQYEVNPRIRFRTGYGYNQNPMADAQLGSIGDVPLPDGIPAVRYVQGQFAAVSQHRLTGGIGIRDVLPGIDADLLAGGMFEGSDQFASTLASVESYWIGSYFTWRFGGSCGRCGN